MRRHRAWRSATCGARADFPWLGIWEENLSRPFLPWAGTSITRGMEFGVSPMPEPRRQMIDRGTLFGVPTYRWIPAKGKVSVEYWAMAQTATGVPERLARPCLKTIARSGRRRPAAAVLRSPGSIAQPPLRAPRALSEDWRRSCGPVGSVEH